MEDLRDEPGDEVIGIGPSCTGFQKPIEDRSRDDEIGCGGRDALQIRQRSAASQQRSLDSVPREDTEHTMSERNRQA